MTERTWPWWYLGLLAVPGPVVYLADWPAWSLAVLEAAALLALHLVVRRRGGWRLLGPHAFHDVVRLSRRGRSTALRVAYLVALLLGLWYTHATTFHGRFASTIRGQEETSANAMARLGTTFAYSLFALQNVAVLLFTPIYVGSALAEERERGTLELLHTTALLDREIVLGKFFARLVHLVGLLVAGLPVLSLLQFWGGIDIWLILGNWVNTLALLAAAGSACLFFSSVSKTVTGAVLASYALLVPVGTCCVGLGQGVLLDDRTGAGGGLAVQSLAPLLVGYALFAWVFLALAVTSVRSPTDYEPPRYAGMGADPDSQVAGAVRAVAPDLVDGPLPPLWANALLWKECAAGPRSLLFSPFMLIPFVPILTGGLMIIVTSAFGKDAGGAVPTVGMRLFYHLFLFGAALGVAFRATAAVARERQQQTLEPLLLLPIDRRDILWAKAVGTFYKGRPWLLLLVLTLALGALLGAYDAAELGWRLVAPLPVLLFLAGLGLLLSVTLQTVLRANLALMLFVLAGVVCAFAGVPGPWTLVEPQRGRDYAETFAVDADAVYLWLAGGFLAGAGMCWRAACWRFERE